MTPISNSKLSIIVTGATGMVGEGVLHECLQSDKVAKVLVINRKPCGLQHPKLKEIIHTDFYNLSPIKQELQGFNTCFFCLGVSSVGMKEEPYYKLTYILTMHVAQMLVEQNDDMTFCYISGAHTDSTEKGKLMWARVKGKTENDLIRLHFKDVYIFRPGILQPTKGLKNTLSFYKYFGWLLPIIKLFGSNSITSLKELGTAMINTSANGYEKKIIEVSDIHILANE